MSLTSSSFSHINLTSPSSTPSPSTSSTLRYYHTCKPNVLTTIRCSQAEGPLRRPVAQPPTPIKPIPPSPPPPSSQDSPPPAKQVAAASVVDKNVITTEFQRQKAKELQEYFKKKKLEEANQGPFFGFIPKNEISNGRWAMFGFAVGMLTEYATGSNFVDQVKILLSNFGIVDLE
ncbi:hypothetical protein LIER_02229 [Lithospermum erythrorhizon]|uniref:Uncharacterized protein n=1 Tax=Lithospermum erythrorhizon TaxID=34254 RepID=A0AAV3NNM8_LITER